MADFDTYQAAAFFVLRTPLLPLSLLRQRSEALAAPERAGDPGEYEQAARADRARLRGLLLEVLAVPGVEEALYVASADLHAAVEAWRRDPAASGDAKVELSLLKYVLRMAARSTPYGLFAGSSVGRIGRATQLSLTDPREWRRHARLDAGLVDRLAGRLEESEQVLRASRWVSNPTVYPAGGGLRYYERETGAERSGFYLSQVEAMPELDLVLARARRGAELDELAGALADAGLDREDAEAFLLELIQNGLLLSCLRPAATGPELAAQLLEALEARGLGGLPQAAALAEVQAGLARLNARELGAPPEEYRALRDAFAAAVPPLPGETSWYLGLVKPGGGATLSAAMARELARAVTALHLVNRGGERNPLAAFKEAFARRYEGEEVPLLLALDDEYGIGLGSGVDAAADPLVGGLPLGAEPERRWKGEHLRLLATLYARGTANGGEAVLTADDLAPLEGPGPELPDTLAVLATCVRTDAGEERVVVKYAQGPGAAIFFGRFCHDDPALEACTRELVAREDAQAGDAVPAEISFLPPGRVGNLLARPVLREVEIALHGRPAAREQLDPAELMVSVVEGEVVLRSRRDGRRVVPRLTSMHVAAADVNLPLYHFLYQVQDDGPRAPGRFDWGPLSAAPYLPRVVFGRAVLSLARWRVTDADAGLGAAGAGAFARCRAVRALRDTLRIPRHVYLARGDNELLLDLDDPACIDLLAAALRKGAVTLTELYPPRLRGEAMVVGRPELDFANEIVVPLVRPAPRPPRGGPAPRPVPPTPLERRLPPGSGCLYAQVFGAPAAADALLTGTLAPVLANAGVARWFFVRYRDAGGHHLRLRLFGEPGQLWTRVLASLHDALAPVVGSGQVWSWELGTYVREVERYGGPAGLQAAEEIFWVDSVAALRVLGALAEGGSAADPLRWQHAVAATHRLLDDFAIPLADRPRLLRSWMAGWEATLNHRGVGLQRALAAKYRVFRESVESLLEGGSGAPLLPDVCREALEERSRRMAGAVGRIRSLHASGALGQPLEAMVESLVHMGMNRLLSVRANAREMVLYDFLARGYASRLARAGGQTGGAG